jgi:hypothetical protein
LALESLAGSPLIGGLLLVDVAFFSANAIKVLQAAGSRSSSR